MLFCTEESESQAADTIMFAVKAYLPLQVLTQAVRPSLKTYLITDNATQNAFLGQQAAPVLCENVQTKTQRKLCQQWTTSKTDYWCSSSCLLALIRECMDTGSTKSHSKSHHMETALNQGGYS